ASLRQLGLPFVGLGDGAAWSANPYGFALDGATVADPPVAANPEWGRTLASLLGTATGRTVRLAVDDDALGRAKATLVTTALRRAGFTVGSPVTVPVVGTPDPVRVVNALLAPAPPDAVMVLTRPAASPALAHALAAAAYTGAVVSDTAYVRSDAPQTAGVTV